MSASVCASKRETSFRLAANESGDELVMSNGRSWQPPNKRAPPSLLDKEAMDQVMAFIDPFKQLSKDSIRLIKRCTKPDRKEFQKIAMATAIGFAIMGFIGFFVKLIHIPINNIIVGS
ncbi:hypothetical protein HPB51_011741 [Rhipicephalus microplus]|uniref:Protein transport protein Sec61 subunit gamma n=6 Tax=Ixodidae TaxID=6939 RepID=A0A9J6DN87_RHIMP|nr:hypothetical protein HPB51_011741 [Rhipicephalus microplus]